MQVNSFVVEARIVPRFFFIRSMCSIRCLGARGSCVSLFGSVIVPVSVLSSPHLSAYAIWLLIANSGVVTEGEASDEIKYRSSAEREDPDKILAILRELYGCSDSFVVLQEAFFSRRQQEGETLQEFSLSLMGLMEKYGVQGGSQAVPSSPVSEIEELRELLKRQQEQLNQLTESIARLQNPHQHGRPPRTGPIICRRCNQPGHFARECGVRVAPSQPFSRSPSNHDVDMGGVKVPCLVDTGSMVSTVSESFFRHHFEPWGQERLHSCNWLQLRAANGLAIPYLGYLELEVQLCDKLMPRCGVLVVKDPPGGLPAQAPQDNPGRAKVRGKKAWRIPGGVMKIVTAICSVHFSGPTVLFEPLDSGLPAGLLASPALVRVNRGTAYIPIVNVGSTDVVLYPRTVVGTLNIVNVVSLPSGVTEVPLDVATVSSQVVLPSVQQQVEDIDLSSLPLQEQGQVRSLLRQYTSVFSTHEGDLGCTSLISHDIPLVDDVPVRQRYRRIPPSEYEVAKEHISQLLSSQVIRESSSPYASPIVLVRKKDNSIRMCVDYRQLNSKTRKDAFPLPRVEEFLDALSGACWFSTLDLTSGYNQMILLFSSTVEQHLERLGVVLDRLQDEGLKAKLSKCSFFQKEVSYLGHVISGEGVSTDPSKIEVVANWPIPTTVSELQSFLGFASYYRRFVEGFAKLAAPLHKAVAEFGSVKTGKRSGRGGSVCLSDECQQSFEALRNRLTTAPVLAYADFSLPFILEVDASHGGLGAVLSQEQAGKVRPIAYASRGLRRPERNMVNYSSMKLEFLALKWAMTEKFREYLLGNKCVVYMDNNPLSHLSSAKLGATEQRWAAQLASFDFEIKYRSGRVNKNADALSRQCPPGPQDVEAMLPGTALPKPLQQVLGRAEATQGVVVAMPQHTSAELRAL
ncbi:hypothetical protein L3Q82_002197 [Scortum barcoo]|uniref:Uncharacterized protein n=1 Tax=Scortum barcoo TaxID=214431 RepID=A0ACB8W255_9TELE|nr:hypothetical protein L3Q82_002197 [Scortum barcoo]